VNADLMPATSSSCWRVTYGAQNGRAVDRTFTK